MRASASERLENIKNGRGIFVSIILKSQVNNPTKETETEKAKVKNTSVVSRVPFYHVLIISYHVRHVATR
jgi:hypothetical protein